MTEGGGDDAEEEHKEKDKDDDNFNDVRDNGSRCGYDDGSDYCDVHTEGHTDY